MSKMKKPKKRKVPKKYTDGLSASDKKGEINKESSESAFVNSVNCINPEYSEEQIFIRSVPCPSCEAQPRQHCFRPVSRKTGLIHNHTERQFLWHKVLKRWELKDKVSRAERNLKAKQFRMKREIFL
mgnify:CR=1 FL=1